MAADVLADASQVEPYLCGTLAERKKRGTAEHQPLVDYFLYRY